MWHTGQYVVDLLSSANLTELSCYLGTWWWSWWTLAFVRSSTWTWTMRGCPICSTRFCVALDIYTLLVLFTGWVVLHNHHGINHHGLGENKYFTHKMSEMKNTELTIYFISWGLQRKVQCRVVNPPFFQGSQWAKSSSSLTLRQRCSLSHLTLVSLTFRRYIFDHRNTPVLCTTK